MGMRPRILGTLTLLQKTALAAATVAATEVAVNAATHAMVSHPLLRHLAGDVACAARSRGGLFAAAARVGAYGPKFSFQSFFVGQAQSNRHTTSEGIGVIKSS